MLNSLIIKLHNPRLNGSLFLKTYNNIDSHAFKTHFAPEDITLLYKSNLVLIKM